jgi:RNA polymerase sigma-70 factor, ECF subfamily
VTTEDRVKELLASSDVSGAATEAIRGLGPTVLSYLRPMLRDEDEVADAFSQWAENLWKGLPRFEFRSSLRTWALRLACNEALQLRGRAARKRERRLGTSEASGIAEAVRTHSVAHSDRRRQELLELRRSLSAEDQTLLFLRVDQRLSWNDVAAALSEGGKHVDPDTACKRFERLRARLEKEAKKRQMLE